MFFNACEKNWEGPVNFEMYVSATISAAVGMARLRMPIVNQLRQCFLITTIVDGAFK